MRTTTIRPTSDGRFLVFETASMLAVLTIDEGIAYLEQVRSIVDVARAKNYALVVEAENEAARMIETALRDALALREAAGRRAKP